MIPEKSPSDIARDFVREGIAPVPVPFRRKAPALSGWQKLQLTVDTVGDYFNDGPQNVGVLMGQPSRGLVDIDLDCDEAVAVTAFFLPNTATFGRKSRRNSHRLYHCPNVKTAKYQADGMLLEIRSDGCQTLMPGSTHPSGECIEWEPGSRKVHRMDAEELQRAVGRSAAAALVARVWKTKVGIRHECALALAGALLHSGWSGDEVTTFIQAVVTAAGDEEGPDRLRAIETSVAQFEAHEPVTGWPSVAELFGDDVVKKLRKWLKVSDGVSLTINGVPVTNGESDEWPDPEPLRRTLPASDAYPVEALGDVLGSMVKEMAAIIQSPIALCAQSVLAAATQAVQAHANIEVDGRTYPLCNYYLTVAQSGERKTASDREALAPHAKSQRELKTRYAEQLTAYKADRAAWKQAHSEVLKKNNNVTKEAKQQALLELGPEPEPPINPILFTEEPTYEGLVKALQTGWPSMGIFSDEGGQLLGGYGMNKDNQLRFATGLSKLWDGAPISRTRGGDGNILLYGRRVSLHLMMQPNVADLLFGNVLLLGQGLLSRCLVCYPESTIGKRPYKATALRDTPAARRYFAVLSTILEAELPLVDGTTNELVPRTITLEKSAKAVWIGFHDHIEVLCAEGRELASIKGLAAKAAEQALRLAGVLALIDNLETRVVSRRHVEAGIMLAQYYIGEALRLFEQGADAPALVLAEQLLDWLRQQNSLTSTNSTGVGEKKETTNSTTSLNSPLIYSTKIYQYGPKRIRDKETTVRLMGILEDHHYVRQIQGGAHLDGKHRSFVWAMSPKMSDVIS